MSHSGLVRPPAGVDMFMNDRVQQMEGEAVKTTYCKGSKWQSGTDWEKKDFRVKKIKCLYREEGMWGVKNLFKSSAISVWGDPKEAKKEFTFSVSALWSVISATNSCYSSLWNDGFFYINLWFSTPCEIISWKIKLTLTLLILVFPSGSRQKVLFPSFFSLRSLEAAGGVAWQCGALLSVPQPTNLTEPVGAMSQPKPTSSL